ncbi:MAG: deoxyhypusine synthase [Thaumarchaeota archaeon]|nr:deoxyhypusine synthase [Nitrososphaerota archaeon]
MTIPRLEKVVDIRLKPSQEVVELLDQMYSAGGFMGRHLTEAARLFTEMVSDKRCTKFLSFPAAPVSTGLRGVIVDMIKENMVDVIITASGTLDHDLARTWGHYYHGSFDMDDSKLLKAGYHRLGNLLVPLDDYGPAIEKKMQPWLDDVYSRGVKSMSTEELCRDLGKMVDDEASLLYWAQKRNVPVFVPGPMDGAVGSQIWLFANRHSDFQIDVIKDEKRLADIIFDSKRRGAMIVGGGITKHHTLWWSQFKGGLDYACYITTAVEYDGSLSGAQVREAVSWGKVKPRAKKANLYADATTVLPMIASYALTKAETGHRAS